MTDAITSYRALALQTECRSVNAATSSDESRARIASSIERIGAQVLASKGFIGADLRLVVLPEYVLTGYPMGESPAEWIDKACLAPDGPEYDQLGKVAASADVWLCGNAYETDAHFEGLYFQTCFTIAPSGEVLTRYRRLTSMYTPTPHDVWDRYLEVYGLDGVFPVARTPLGILAPIASEEVLYPELVRCFVLRGAEVLVHSTSEVSSPIDTPKAIARRARAIENATYVVAANTAGIIGTTFPAASTDGGSCVIDPSGRVLAQAGQGETMVANAEIDLGALRRERRRPGMGNILSRQRFEAVAQTYAQTRSYPPNTLLEGPPPGRAHYVDTQRAAIQRLIDDGVIT